MSLQADGAGEREVQIFGSASPGFLYVGYDEVVLVVFARVLIAIFDGMIRPFVVLKR